MKRYILLLSFFFVFVLPNFIISVVNRDKIPEILPVFTAMEQNEVQQQIRIESNSNVLEIDLEEYVLGVLLGEMPTDFELEALKAQAVATRTYTLYAIEKGTKHSQGYLCTDATCCQAYSDPGKFTDDVFEKFRSAVTETAYQVLTYEDALIEATYFSCSGGITEDAVAVWGVDVPYLRSVVSPGEENAGRYETQIQFTQPEFLQKLGLDESIKLSDSSFVLTYTQGGGIARMYVANTCFTGVQLRSLLELPSTAFTLSVHDDNVYIRAKGYGHRVGLSQYGAEAMAVSGKGYEDILMHYYHGTTLKTLTEDQIKAIFDKGGNL